MTYEIVLDPKLMCYFVWQIFYKFQCPWKVKNFPTQLRELKVFFPLKVFNKEFFEISKNEKLPLNLKINSNWITNCILSVNFQLKIGFFSEVSSKLNCKQENQQNFIQDFWIKNEWNKIATFFEIIWFSKYFYCHQRFKCHEVLNEAYDPMKLVHKRHSFDKLVAYSPILN